MSLRSRDGVRVGAWAMSVRVRFGLVAAALVALGAVFAAGCDKSRPQGGDCDDPGVHCQNGVMDCDEEDVDCGGSCIACDDPCLNHCSNGAMDCQEDGVDCGGECPACPRNDAAFVSQVVPTPVGPGASFEVEVVMRNTGVTTWTPDVPNPYRLGSWNPVDNGTWGRGRVELADATAVAPGETYTFTFTVTAPSQPGTYNMQWSMLEENVEWFGEPTVNVEVTVEGWPEYTTNPFTFTFDEPVPDWSGGFFVHDLDGDGLLDFVISSDTNVSAYDHYGVKLWATNVGINTSGQYPGAHHPGVMAGDMDGDGVQEVGYLTPAGNLRILDGVTGAEEDTQPFAGAQAVVIANLRGLGDRDAILQYSQTELRAVRLDTYAQLWQTTEYISAEHSPARQADLDGDGLDEVAGLTFIDDDGSLMSAWDLAQDRGTNVWAVDSISIADIVPGGPLEAAVAEQGGNNEAIVVNHNEVVFGTYNTDNPCCAVAGECAERDCDKVAVGDFRPARAGLEVFCRSACGRAPWLLNNSGGIVTQWAVDDTKPASWFIDGIEEVCAIDWDGNNRREIVAKERHVEEDVGIIRADTGEFLVVFPAQAARVYAVDLAGDGREEVVVLDNRGEIRVYWNESPSAGDSSVSPWTLQHYRRQKQNWNYYSP